MAKTNPVLGPNSGKLGDLVYYTRFGKEFVRRKAEHFNDRQSEAQLRQRTLFKAMQHTSALLGSVLQRGLTQYAHNHGNTEANEFSRLNKGLFTFANGKVTVDYPALQLARGPLPVVVFTECRVAGHHVDLSFSHSHSDSNARPDDVVHIYAVSPSKEICMLMASVERRSGHASFDLPVLRDDNPTSKRSRRIVSHTGGTTKVDYHLYAIVEASVTAHIPTLSADEKRVNKQHRNINRLVSNSIYIALITTEQ